jgi:hypothetical protein
MKYSQANEIYQARLEFNSQYEGVSLADDDGSTHHARCDICKGLPGDVSEIRYLAKADTAKGIFGNVYEGDACGGCICSAVYGDDSDLDFCATEKDEQPKWRGK